jgi:adenylosuccinate lyase
MRRLFWTALGVGFGAAAGVLAARKLRRAQDALTPTSMAGAIAGAVGNLGDAIRDFAADVRDGMAEREAELTEALGFDDPYPVEPRAAR